MLSRRVSFTKGKEVGHTTDYYSLLGIKRSANPTEIKQAYRKMVFRYHPDRNPEDDQAAEMFKQVLEAYETLSDGERISPPRNPGRRIRIERNSSAIMRATDFASHTNSRTRSSPNPNARSAP